MKVAALVLAAGTSSRMGRPKQLLPYEGKSLVRRAAEAAVGSRARQTIVVTGAAREQVELALGGLAVMLVHNPDFSQGMSTSLRAGLRAVRPDIDAVIVMLADQPFIDSSVIDALIERYEQSGARIVRPRYGGVPGNPVLWDSSHVAALAAQEGDQGGRSLLQALKDQIAWLELPDANFQTDVDTPEAYASLTGALPAVPVADDAPGPVGQDLPAGGHDDDQSAAAPVPDTSSSHPHVGGIRFCARCATPLELLPISYDNNREHLACPACNFVVWEDPKVAALTVVPWQGGILLGLRNQNPGKGRWSFPSGFVDRGEPVEEAARRETREETGLEVDITGLIGVYSAPGNPVIVIAFAGEPTGGELRAGDDLSELRAYAPDRLPKLAFAHDEGIIRDWLALIARQGASVGQTDAPTETEVIR
jgi:CTP:molybdopterin cytidylyltransferase MocA/ADP-ribose pyrophosphatase YjhB (NUDIX family)